MSDCETTSSLGAVSNDLYCYEFPANEESIAFGSLFAQNR